MNALLIQIKKQKRKKCRIVNLNNLPVIFPGSACVERGRPLTKKAVREIPSIGERWNLLFSNVLVL